MNVSIEYALALNIRNAAEQHKRTCDENCCVSLTQLRDAVKYLKWKAPQLEHPQFDAWAKEMLEWH